MLNILLHYPFNWLISVGASDSVGDSNSVGASDSDKPFGTQFAVFSEAQEMLVQCYGHLCRGCTQYSTVLLVVFVILA